MALCHSIIVEDTKDGGTIYNSASPDELALVQFAKYAGWEFTGINKDNEMVISKRRKMDDKPEIGLYHLEETLDFSSKRKRMSVIVKPSEDNPNGNYVLYMKGADSIVFPRCKDSYQSI